MRGSYLCKECEEVVLKTHTTRRHFLSAVMGLLIIAVLYMMWAGYQANKDEVDFGLVEQRYDNFLSLMNASLDSPLILIPAVLLLIIVAFIIGTKLSK